MSTPNNYKTKTKKTNYCGAKEMKKKSRFLKVPESRLNKIWLSNKEIEREKERKKAFKVTLHVKHCLCQLAFNAIIVLSVIGSLQPSHLAANNFSKSGLQYGFPSRSKNGTAAIGFLHGPAQTKWSSCHVLPMAFTTFCYFEKE